MPVLVGDKKNAPLSSKHVPHQNIPPPSQVDNLSIDHIHFLEFLRSKFLNIIIICCPFFPGIPCNHIDVNIGIPRNHWCSISTSLKPAKLISAILPLTAFIEACDIDFVQKIYQRWAKSAFTGLK